MKLRISNHPVDGFDTDITDVDKTIPYYKHFVLNNQLLGQTNIAPQFTPKQLSKRFVCVFLVVHIQL